MLLALLGIWGAGGIYYNVMPMKVFIQFPSFSPNSGRKTYSICNPQF